MNFGEYLEESKTKGEAMEEVIVGAWNGEVVHKKDIPPDAGIKIAKYLEKEGVFGETDHLARGAMDVSETWKKYWNPKKVPPSTRTPKTDFIIGDHKISLKTGGKAQLMSGGQRESKATFYAAIAKTGSKLRAEMIDVIEGKMNKLSEMDIAPDKLKPTIANKLDDKVTLIDQVHKDLMMDLSSMIKNNDKFSSAFAYEAMTGEVKFSDGIGACDHFLNVDWNGDSPKLISVKDEDYVRKIAEQMRVSVRFKTKSEKIKGQKTGRYKYWSVVGLVADKLNESAVANGETLLTEGSFDRAWGRIKNWFMGLMKKIKEWLGKSYRNIFEFFNAEPEIELNSVVDVYV